MTSGTILLITGGIMIFTLLVVFISTLLGIAENQKKILNEYNKVTKILGVDDVPSKPTKYEAGDIVVVHDTRFNEYSVVHLRNVYCLNKIWLYSGIAIEFVKAPSKYGVRKIPTYRTTISGIREENIQPIDSISMKVFKWSKDQLC